MRIDRRTFLLTAVAATACSRRRGSEDPLQRAVEYLRTQQAEDGGFHSSTYGLLRSGQSLTPLVLGALLSVPGGKQANSQAIERGIEFIKRNTNAEGALGRMNDSAEDYPNYATSLAVLAIVNAGMTGWEQQIAPMIDQLRKQQFSEAQGWKEDDAPFGGWGMGGELRRPPDAGHVDLSMTRCVLEALRAAGVPSSDPVIARAVVFLKRSQNADGGFYFSPVNLEKNKAGETDGQPLSYGTATADGLLALRAAGIPDTDDRNSRAIEWLKAHHQPDRAPGFAGARASWGTGLRYYYAYVISHALPELRVELPNPAADGSFANHNKMVKEDDPLIATSFAIHVLHLGRGAG
jgi:prenyltransferase beta subunit